jgi:hypothetical protein
MDIVRKEPHHGWIEVITGSMFSGKSEELIRRLRRTQIARQKVQIFKPLIDNRFSEDHIVSHSDMRIASQNVRNSDELVRQVAEDTEVVGSSNEGFRSEPAAASMLADRASGDRPAGSDYPDGRRAMPQPLAIGNTSPRRWPSASSAATRRTTRSGWSRAATACWSARPACTRRAAATASIRTWRSPGRRSIRASANSHQP